MCLYLCALVIGCFNAKVHFFVYGKVFKTILITFECQCGIITINTTLMVNLLLSIMTLCLHIFHLYSLQMHFNICSACSSACGCLFHLANHF